MQINRLICFEFMGYILFSLGIVFIYSFINKLWVQLRDIDNPVALTFQ